MNRDVHLLVQGALLERLLEKALAEGAVFARIRRIDERSMRIETDVRSADTLIRMCRRYSLNCRTLRRGGRTALWNLARRRWTVLPGTALCFVICALFLSRVWLVDIRFTNAQINPDIQRRIAACLEENGIRPGMAASAVDTSHLQTQITASVENLSYAGVRLQGIRLLVETSPEVPAPKLYSLSDVRNLYAVRNGVVESVTVYSGEAFVQPGDTVLAGEVLIRGVEDKSKEETTPVGALGKVIARCWYEGAARGALYSKQAVRTGRSSFGCRLRLGDFSLTLTECEDYASEETQTEVLPIVGLFLPLELERTTHFETALHARSADRATLERQLAVLARADALVSMQAEDMEYEIASTWTDTQQSGNTLRVRAVYEIYTDIAATRDALTEEVY